MKKAEAYWPLILLLALVKFVLPLFLQSSIYELHRDEYLYYEQGQHLALGYLENPPILSWLGRISAIFGGSPAWIKFWPSAFGSATLIFTCLIAAEFGGNRFAQFLAGLGIIAGSYLRMHFLFQPNSVDVFSWTLVIYFLIRYIHSQKVSDIYWLAGAIAFGWWGKYSILFMGIGLVGGLILTHHRKIFTRKHTWFAAAMAFVLILPNLAWQYFHNWPLVHHMKELQETQLGKLSMGEFFEEQLLMLLPVVFVWIAGLIWLLKKREFRIVGIIYLIIIVLLVGGSGKGYYALGAYPMLLAAGGVAWESITVNRSWIRWSVSAIALLLFLMMIPLLLPIWKPEKIVAFSRKYGIDHTWEDRRKHDLSQDFADMLGWKEYTERSQRFFESLPDTERQHTIVYCGSYGQAGALRYYTTNKEFRDRVITTNGSFVLWLPETAFNFKNMLLIDDEVPDNELFTHFEKMTMVDSVRNEYSRQYGDKIIFYENIDGEGLQMATGMLRQQRAQFAR